MDSKRCTTCHKVKQLDHFSKYARNKDGRQPRCRKCASDYYAAHRDKIYPMIKERRAQVIIESRMYIWMYLLGHPCVDCGEGDPVVLEFDHVRGKKRFNLSSMPSGGWGVHLIAKEIAKCEVRCANCHRRKTARDQGWYMLFRAARARLDGHLTFNQD
jgi:hypothetical protein